MQDISSQISLRHYSGESLWSVVRERSGCSRGSCSGRSVHGVVRGRRCGRCSRHRGSRRGRVGSIRRRLRGEGACVLRVVVVREACSVAGCGLNRTRGAVRRRSGPRVATGCRDSNSRASIRRVHANPVLAGLGRSDAEADDDNEWQAESQEHGDDDDGNDAGCQTRARGGGEAVVFVVVVIVLTLVKIPRTIERLICNTRTIRYLNNYSSEKSRVYLIPRLCT